MIHLVYPYSDKKIAAPWSIGNHLGKLLEEVGYKVKQYDWEESCKVDTHEDDILLGHPHPEKETVFDSLSYRIPTYTIFPYNGTRSEFVKRNTESYKHAFLICGPSWARDWNGNTKVTCLDMAVDINDYPKLKKQFNPVGDRRILYIGCTEKEKGTQYLANITRKMPDVYFGHMGYGLIAGTWPWYYRDMSDKYTHEILEQFDYVITVGSNDANPTTILEACAWGLIPISVPGSGWDETVSNIISENDPDAAVKDIRKILGWSDDYMKILQKKGFDTAEYYSWWHFVQPILDKFREDKIVLDVRKRG